MIIAVDTGGTKTLVALFSERGVIEKSVKFPTPKNFDDYFQELCKTIRDLLDGETPENISIGLPGRIDGGQTLIYARNIGWKRDINFKKLLEAEFSCLVTVENDANLAGIAEIRTLPSIPKIGLYITISTGIGTGLIIDGNLQPLWSQSEGGQIVLEHDGVMKTWEEIASGKSIYSRYKKYAKDITSERTWHQIATDISRGIVALSPVLQPNVIVIGGSIGTYFHKYEKSLLGIIREQLNDRRIPIIKKAQHPEEAVIYGCYYHALDQRTA